MVNHTKMQQRIMLPPNSSTQYASKNNPAIYQKTSRQRQSQNPRTNRFSYQRMSFCKHKQFSPNNHLHVPFPKRILSPQPIKVRQSPLIRIHSTFIFHFNIIFTRNDAQIKANKYHRGQLIWFSPVNITFRQNNANALSKLLLSTIHEP